MPDTQKNLHKKFLGRSGEYYAAVLLKKKKYKILKKNFKTDIGEIDIVASLDGIVVFVEVKTRLGDKYGRPSEAVNFAKQRKYRMIAMQFLNQNGLIDAPIRFDIIEITPQEINHIENAF